jgi:hypothetical protein
MIEDMAQKNIFVPERSCVKSVQKTAQNLSYLEILFAFSDAELVENRMVVI